MMTSFTEIENVKGTAVYDRKVPGSGLNKFNLRYQGELQMKIICATKIVFICFNFRHNWSADYNFYRYEGQKYFFHIRYWNHSTSMQGGSVASRGWFCCI